MAKRIESKKLNRKAIKLFAQLIEHLDKPILRIRRGKVCTLEGKPVTLPAHWEDRQIYIFPA